MEWQAGFACGALLMPKRALLETVNGFRRERSIFGQIGLSTDAGRALIGKVMGAFGVSQDAATVRLKERKVLVDQPSASLFA
jgi:hypothetical protein